MTELAVIVPTFNEAENVPLIVERLESVLEGVEFEIVFVDDNSPDRTWERVEALHRTRPHVRVLRRIGRRGLSSAVIEGVMSTDADYVAVMDADLQHDETILPKLLLAVREGADVAIGTRYAGDGGLGDWERGRARLSRFATRLASALSPHPLSDPMSGFFVADRDRVVDKVEELHVHGFKILMDLLDTYEPGELRIAEVPYRFRRRIRGQSKLTPLQAVQFLEYLYERKLGWLIPLRFVKYALVGSAGALVHFSVLALAYRGLEQSYRVSLGFAIEAAILFNYVLNNLWTFRDFALRSWNAWAGLAKFNLFCAFGGWISWSVSNHLFYSVELHWIVASTLGAATGVLWNYELNRSGTWRARSVG